MMTRLSDPASRAIISGPEVKSKGVKNLVKRLEEPGFPATLACVTPGVLPHRDFVPMTIFNVLLGILVSTSR